MKKRMLTFVVLVCLCAALMMLAAACEPARAATTGALTFEVLDDGTERIFDCEQRVVCYRSLYAMGCAGMTNDNWVKSCVQK